MAKSFKVKQIKIIIKTVISFIQLLNIMVIIIKISFIQFLKEQAINNFIVSNIIKNTPKDAITLLKAFTILIKELFKTLALFFTNLELFIQVFQMQFSC